MQTRAEDKTTAELRPQAEPIKQVEPVATAELGSAAKLSAEEFAALAEEMVERYGPLVYKICLARSLQSQDADDLFQEVFLAYSKHRPRFNEAEHAKAWFIRVSCNVANSFWRKPQQKRELPFAEELQQDEEAQLTAYDLVEEESERQLQAIDLQRCLETLTAEERQLIHLFYYEELKGREIAEILAKREGSLRMQLSRARKALKNCLEKGVKAHGK